MKCSVIVPHSDILSVVRRELEYCHTSYVLREYELASAQMARFSLTTCGLTVTVSLKTIRCAPRATACTVLFKRYSARLSRSTVAYHST